MKKGDIIKLNPCEMEIANLMAKQIHEGYAGQDDQWRRCNQDEFNKVHLMSFAGEMALGKHLNVYPDFTIGKGKRKGFDLLFRGTRIDVKTMEPHERFLLAKKHHTPADVDMYVLLSAPVLAERFMFVGWCYSHVLLQTGNLHDFGKGPGNECYRMYLDQLETEMPDISWQFEDSDWCNNVCMLVGKQKDLCEISKSCPKSQ